MLIEHSLCVRHDGKLFTLAMNAPNSLITTAALYGKYYNLTY